LQSRFIGAAPTVVGWTADWFDPNEVHMNDRIHRREALRHLAVVSISAFAPAMLAACSKKPSCSDLSGLSTDEVNQRNSIAAYTETAMDASKRCSLCAQFVPAAPNACGSCKVVKGPINPEGTCKLFVAKPA
jgi:hypothetical protein